MSASAVPQLVTRENWREMVEHLATREAAASGRERTRLLAEILETLAAASMSGGPEAMLEHLRERVGAASPAAVLDAAASVPPADEPLREARGAWFEAANVASALSELLVGDARLDIGADADHRVPDVIAHYIGTVEATIAAGYTLLEVLDNRISDVEKLAAARA